MPFHNSAIEILELIASYQAQRDYEKNVAIANVPAELVCLWFDDFHHLTSAFKAEFTEKELNAGHKRLQHKEGTADENYNLD